MSSAIHNFQQLLQKDMISPYDYCLQFITIRIVCPRTNAILMEAQRGVDFINKEPDWDQLDDVVSTFLDAQDIDFYNRLDIPEIHPEGGWVTHTFDMGCPRQIWIIPDPVRAEGSS
jgi:hypothetical protein